MEDSKSHIYKGEKLEEVLREYFLNLGFYVARGVKFKYQKQDITDVDLWLYNRVSSINRYRINVDVKNKKSPQALERIFWARGVKETLKLDDCIVATTDNRPVVKSFGILQGVKVIDSNFISRLRYVEMNRIPEDTFLHILTSERSEQYKTDWKGIYENSKSRLISEMDYSGCNACLIDIRYFFEKVIINPISRKVATRILYAVISHFIIILDFLLEDLSFLDIKSKGDGLSDGLKFGNLGREGIDRIAEIALRIANDPTRSLMNVKALFEDEQVNIIKEFFSKNEVARNLFKIAKDFESIAFNNTFIPASELNSDLKSVVSVLLDYCQIERRNFFDLFGSNDMFVN